MRDILIAGLVGVAFGALAGLELPKLPATLKPASEPQVWTLNAKGTPVPMPPVPTP